jgi:hypothetical protein
VYKCCLVSVDVEKLRDAQFQVIAPGDATTRLHAG